MIPYLKEFSEQKIRDYKKYIKEGNKGNFSIVYGKNIVTDGYLYEFKEEIAEETIELREKDKLWMRISPHEIQGCFESVERASGKVGVVGLGVGYFVQEALKKEEVTEVVVYEISEEVIQLYKDNFGKNKKLRIMQGDAFKANGEEFDFFFVDIYQYKLSVDVVDHYKKFQELHNIKLYSFWGIEHFILSCPTHKIVWVYIHEEWMDMCKDLFERFDQSKYIKYFKPINEEKSLKVLDEFSKIL